MGENTITNIMKVSVAGTSLKRVRKFTNRRARKTTFSKLKKAMIVSSQISSTTTMKPAKKREDDSLAIGQNEIMKTPALRKSKYYINTGSFHFITTVAPLTHRWQRRKKTKLIASFIFGF